MPNNTTPAVIFSILRSNMADMYPGDH